MRRLIGAFLFVFILGCSVGPDYKTPKKEISSNWSELPSSGVSTQEENIQKWWALFQDPMLGSLVERAVKSNHDLREAEARVREARAQRGVASSQFWPNINTAAQYQRVRQSENLSFVASGIPEAGFAPGLERDIYEAGFDASWEIDIFGKVRRSVEAAKADLAAVEENRRDVLVSLLSEVTRNYIEARGFQRRLAVAKNNIRTQEAVWKLTKSRFDAGLTSELDSVQARAQWETTQSQIPALESLLRQAIHRLGVLIGEEPGSLLKELLVEAPIPTASLEIPIGLPSDLLRRRADIRRVERELAAATARIGVATADLFPRLSLTGAFGLQSEELDDFTSGDSRFWNVGPALRWPIFQGGRIRNNIKVQNARQEAALIRYEKAVLTSLEDVENALVKYSNEKIRFEHLSRAVDANAKAVDLANERYTKGLSDFLNVLDAQRLLYLSQDELVQSQVTVVSNAVALYKALGGGWEVEEN